MEVPTEAPTERPAIEEPVVTETPVPTEPPNEAPLVCVELLTPEDSIEIYPIGKVTFSWTPMDEANLYHLNIILPTGASVTFETDGATRDRYMAAFGMAGEFRWNVTALNADGEEICSSDWSSPSSSHGYLRTRRRVMAAEGWWR